MEKEIDRCQICFECGGNCWLNIGADYDAWEVISSKCKGTTEEQSMLNDMFNDKRDRKDILKRYDFSDYEKDVLKEFWY